MWPIWWSSSRSRSAGLFVRLRDVLADGRSRHLHAFCGKTKRLSAQIKRQRKSVSILDYRRNLLISGGQLRGAAVLRRVTEDYRVINREQIKVLPQKFPQVSGDRNERGFSKIASGLAWEAEAADGGWRTAGLPDRKRTTGAGWSRVWKWCRFPFPFPHGAWEPRAGWPEPGCQTWCYRPG